jgi:hypothetical protein
VGTWVFESFDKFLVAKGVYWAPIINSSFSLKVVGFLRAELALVFEIPTPCAIEFEMKLIGFT